MSTVYLEENGRLVAASIRPYDVNLKEIVKASGGEFDKKNSVWKMPRDPFTLRLLVRDIRKAGGDVNWTRELEEWGRRERAHADEIIACREGLRKLTVPVADRLWDYQPPAVAFAATAQRAIIGDDMGLGKTIEAIVAISELEEDGFIPNGYILVICTKTARENWESEIGEWYLGQYPKVHFVGAPKTLKDPEPGWHIINWQLLAPRLALLKKIPFDAVLADEGHRARNRKTQQSKALRSLHPPIRFDITGTPVKSDVTDLWAQLNWLYPDRYTSYWRFFERYVDYDEGYFGREIKGTKNEEELRERLKTIMIARTSKEVETGIPPERHEVIRVDLEGNQRKAYEQMRDEFVAWIDGYEDDRREHIVAPNWLTQTLRLKQIAGALGIFYPREKEESAKIDALLELIDGIRHGEHFVVMSQFNTVLERVMLRLQKEKIGHGVLTGQHQHIWNGSDYEQQETRQSLINAWGADPDCPILLANAAAGGESINLTAARYFAFLDLLWTPADNRQAWKRVHRGGQKEKAIIYAILAKDTVDYSLVLPRLKHKQEIVNAVMNPKVPTDDDVKAMLEGA